MGNWMITKWSSVKNISSFMGLYCWTSYIWQVELSCEEVTQQEQCGCGGGGPRHTSASIKVKICEHKLTVVLKWVIFWNSCPQLYNSAKRLPKISSFLSCKYMFKGCQRHRVMWLHHNPALFILHCMTQPHIHLTATHSQQSTNKEWN